MIARLTPKTLFGRNLLLIIVLIALAELGIGLLFRLLIQQPRMVSMQQYAVRQAHNQLALLQALTPEARRQWQATIGASLPATSAAASLDAPEPGFEWRSGGWARLFRYQLDQQLRRELAPGSFRLHAQDAHDAHAGSAPQLAHAGPRLWLGLQVAGQWYWLELDQSGLPPNMPPLVLIATLAGCVLALTGAVLISRRINRPLQQLAAAASAIGRSAAQAGGLPADLVTHSRNAPREIAQLGHSLTRMADDLAAAERERVVLLAGVSHDLRTPLTKLRLAVEILGSGPLGQQDTALLGGMVQHIGHANAVIEQFMAFARSGSDEAVQTIDLVALLRQLAQTETGRIKLALPPLPASGTLPVRVRPVALQRALANLLENAARYAPGSPVELGLQSEGEQVCLSVADRGPGLTEQQIEQVRQPFVRAGNSQVAGAGLGLAIVERIMRLHGGQMRLQAREGGGLLVWLCWPGVAR
jgi:two-component system osmolarity sensor histidine kinase EnvZ